MCLVQNDVRIVDVQGQIGQAGARKAQCGLLIITSILGNAELNIIRKQKMLWRKIKHPGPILILHQVSCYSPYWGPITDAVMLL